MNNKLSIGVIIGICIGISIGLVVGGCILIWYRVQKRKKQIQCSHDQRGMSLPIRVNGLGASSMLSDITIDADSPPHGKESNAFKSWFTVRQGEKNSILSHSGLPNFPYR